MMKKEGSLLDGVNGLSLFLPDGKKEMKKAAAKP